jgi:cytochrome c-type biogenesis protein CcmH
MSRLFNEVMMSGINKTFFVFLISVLGTGAAGCNSSPPDNSVSGTIRLSSSLPAEANKMRTLFVMLYPEAGGPPVAFQRLVRVKFPYRYILTKNDMMFHGGSFEGKFQLKARLDADGRIGAFVRGDYEGVNKSFLPMGTQDADVLIDTPGTAEPPKINRNFSQKGGQAAHPPVGKFAAPSPPVAQMPLPAAAPPVEGGSSVSGTIKIAPALKGKELKIPVVFIIARGENPGPPVAVAKISNPRFPLPFTLSHRHVMMQGQRLQGKIRITVRLDSDGSAGPRQPGDLEGKTPGAVSVGESGILITVDKAY